LGINQPRQITLKKGESVTLHGEVTNYSDCSDPVTAKSACVATFRQTFNYDAIVSGTAAASGVISSTALYGTCTQDITYDLVVN
jgi:hypothetical protein